MRYSRKIVVKLKDKVFQKIIRPAMTYGSECWAVKTKGGDKLDSAEMRMLRWARGKTILFLVDYIRHYNIRKVAHIKHIK